MGLKESGLRGSLRSTSSVLPAFFDVTITNTNSPVQEGDILTVDYSADNTGDAQDTQDIRLEIDSVEEDRDSDITLLGAQSTTGTLEWDTTDEAEAEYTATVLSDDDSDSVTVEIGSAIPDSVGNRYTAVDAGVSDGQTPDPWPDIVGDIDLDLTSGSPTLNTESLNGVDAIDTRNTDAFYEYSNNVPNSGIEEPCTILMAINIDSISSDETLWRDEVDSVHELRENDGQWRLRIDGDDNTGGSADAGDTIISLAVDSESGDLRVNGSDVTSASVDSGQTILSDTDDSGFFGAIGLSRFAEVLAGEIVIHPDKKLSGSELTDEEERLEQEYNMDVLQ